MAKLKQGALEKPGDISLLLVIQTIGLTMWFIILFHALWLLRFARLKILHVKRGPTQNMLKGCLLT